MSDTRANIIADGFLKYLKNKKSIVLLPEILSSLQKFKDASLTSAVVFSSDVLSKIQTQKITDILRSRFGTEKIEFKIDQSLMGGIKIKIGNKILDLSVSAKLDQMNNSI